MTDTRKSLDNNHRETLSAIAGDQRLENADLIVRLERWTEPNRTIDVAIANVVFDLEWRPYGPRARTRWGFKRGTDDVAIYGEERICHYQTSIEDALTLLPKWASFELTRSAAGAPTFTRCRLWDWRRGPTMTDPDNEWKAEGNRPLPVNICIAALRARETGAAS